MTVASNIGPTSSYLGNDLTYQFNYDFRALTSSDVIVTALMDVTDPDSVRHTLVAGVDYSLTMKAFPLTGGVVTLIEGAQDWMTNEFLKNGVTLVISFNLAPSQSSKFRDWGPLAPVEIEKALDRNTTNIISVKEVLNRTLKIQIEGSDSIDPTMPSMAGQALKLVHVNATEDGYRYDVTTAEIFLAEANAEQSAQEAQASSESAAASAIAAQAAQAAAELAETGAQQALVDTQAEAAAAIIAINANEASSLADIEAARLAALAEVTAATGAAEAAVVEAAVVEAEAARDLAETYRDQALGHTTTAQAFAVSAAASYDSFDDRYLGSKAAAPTLDNDGNALLTGALYFDTIATQMFVYNGASWDALSGGGAGGGISAWITANLYAIDDVVHTTNKIYLCLVNHTSGVFATDLAANNWVELSEGVDLISNQSISGDKTFTADVTSTDYVFSDVDYNTVSTKHLLSDLDSTGVAHGMVLTVTPGTDQFAIASGEMNFVVNQGANSIKTVTYVGSGAQTLTAVVGTIATYIGIDVTSTIFQQTTPFTNTQRRTIAQVGIIIHDLNSTNIIAANQAQHVSVSPSSQVHDLENGLGAFNVNGNLFAAHDTTFEIKKSVGVIHKTGCNWDVDPLSPNDKELAALPIVTFQYRFSTGANLADTTTPNAAIYENLATPGVTTPVGGGFTVQRIWVFSSNLVRIQLGQKIYSSIDLAIEGIGIDAYTTDANMAENGMLRGFLVMRYDTNTNAELKNPVFARFIEASKFGGVTGTSSVSATTLQGAYNNSATPEITTDSTLGALSVKRGSALDTDNVYEGKNGAGTTTFAVDGAGKITGTDLILGTTKETTRQVLGAQRAFDGLEDKTKFSTSYNPATRVFTATYALGAAVSVGGVRYLKGIVGGETEVIAAHANTSSKFFYYYDNTGALVVSSTVWDLLGEAGVAPLELVVFESIGAKALNIDEKHSGIYGMDSATHHYLHTTRGTQLVSGGVVTGALTSAKTIGVTAGSLADEDNITATAAATAGVTNLRKYYRKAGLTTWDWEETNALCALSDGADPRYDLAGTLTSITANNRWWNMWVMLVPAVTGQPQIGIITGQALYTSLATAQAATVASELSNYNDLTSELVFVAQITLRRVMSFANSTVESITRIVVNTVASSASANFVDLSTNQTIDGNKTFTGITTIASLISALSTKTTTYPITTADNVLLGDCTSAGFTMTLPTAVGFSGLWFRIKKIDATVNALTIATTSAQTIDGEASLVLSTPYQAVTLISNGTNWSLL